MRDRRAERDDRERLGKDRQGILFGQFGSAIEPDRLQQVDRQRFVERSRNPQVRTHRTRACADNEEHDCCIHVQTPAVKSAL